MKKIIIEITEDEVDGKPVYFREVKMQNLAPNREGFSSFVELEKSVLTTLWWRLNRKNCQTGGYREENSIREQVETQTRMKAWCDACYEVWSDHAKDNKMKTIKYITMVVSEGILAEFVGLRVYNTSRKDFNDTLLAKYRKPKHVEAVEES